MSQTHPSEVSILTGARLHFGPLSYHPATGRHFGGIGLMIEAPGWHLRFRHAEDNRPGRIHGIAVDRVLQMLDRLSPEHRSAWNLSAVDLEVVAEIPAHRGLGSGTQLALALGEGLGKLSGEQLPTPVIAQRFQRGLRSAIGIAGYDQGGFLIDAGQAAAEELGELACRVAVPEEWRIVLLTPDAEVSGYSGQKERQAFHGLAPMSLATSGRLARLALTEMLPALATADCTAFSLALDEYGQSVGEFFRPVQGGVFAHSVMESVVARLRSAGRCGLAQSSWGPTVAHVVESAGAAEEFIGLMATLNLPPLEAHVVAVRN